MLVVTRRAGDRIVIPKANIEIIVTKVMPNGQVRIGIEAPKDVEIFRAEVARHLHK